MVYLKHISIAWILTLFLGACTQTTNESSDDNNITQSVSDVQDTLPISEISNIAATTNHHVTQSVSDVQDTLPISEISNIATTTNHHVTQSTSDVQDTLPIEEIFDTPIIPQPQEEVDEIINRREQSMEVEEEVGEIILTETIPSNWYVRVIAEDGTRHLKTTVTQLGALETAIEANKQTVLSGGRFVGPYLDIVFINPVDKPAGNYKTHYHEYAENVDDEWEFVVQTNDANAEINLTWNGLYSLTSYLDSNNRLQYKEHRSLSNPLVEKMKLFDADSGVEIPVSINGEAQIYSFNMNGQNERIFRWILRYE